MVFAEGSPEADAYSNKENQPAATLRMRVREIQLLGGRSEGGQENSNAGSYSNSNYNSGSVSNKTAATNVDDAADDLPF